MFKDINTGTLISRPWTQEELRKQCPKRRCLPRPDEPPIGHCVRRGYEDGGIVGQYFVLYSFQKVLVLTTVKIYNGGLWSMM